MNTDHFGSYSIDKKQTIGHNCLREEIGNIVSGWASFSLKQQLNTEEGKHYSLAVSWTHLPGGAPRPSMG